MRRAAAAAVAATLLIAGCAHQPRFLAAWYLTSERGCSVTILLVNGGLKQTTVASVTLNGPDGPRVDGGAVPHSLAPGEALELHPAFGRTAAACDRTPPPSPPPPPDGERHCLPIRLFVSEGSGRRRPRQVDIDRPMPTAFAKQVFLPCGLGPATSAQPQGKAESNES